MTSSTKKRNTDPTAVVLFCKVPVAGRVKTRLAADFAQAVEFFAAMLHALIERLHAAYGNRLYIFADDVAYFEECYPDVQVFQQTGDGLGERMQNAFAYLFSRGDIETVVLAGSDVPEFDADQARKMSSLCGEYDAVLLPSSDGGYSAVALHRSVGMLLDRCFRDIEWSTPSVLAMQMQRFHEAGCRALSMDVTVDDVDVLEDLLAFRKRAARSEHPYVRLVPEVVAVLPVLNEAESLPKVLPPLSGSIWVNQVVCVDNGSTDDSPRIIQEHGAVLLRCEERGYGAAMLTGIEHVSTVYPSDTIILFLDADGSDDQSRIPDLLRPIFAGQADLVLGARKGRILPHQRMGNWLALLLMRWLWGRSFADLGPFRAIRLSALQSLAMDDRNYGWTIQMQVRALVQGLVIREVPVDALPRLGGKSKVSGTLRGTWKAGTVILRTIVQEWKKQRKSFTSNKLD